MRVEEIALRQEIRQMLNEAGYNRNTLKELVKEVMHDELRAAIKQACNEQVNLEEFVHRELMEIVAKTARTELRDRITSKMMDRWMHEMKVSVTIDSKFDDLVEGAMENE